MPKNPTGLAVAPTKRRWNDGIKFDFKTLFVGLGKSLVKLNYQDLPGAALAAADAVKAVGKKTDPEQLARQWVLRALTRAVYQLAGDSRILARTKTDAEELDAQAEKSLQNQPVLLNKDTLNSPVQLPLVKAVEKPLAQWLQGWDVDPTPSKTIASRLGVYFTRALYDEWNRDFSTADQAAIRGVLDNPITTAVERDWAWGDYHSRLEQEVAEPVFGIEPFSLAQIHVDLHGYYETRKKTKGRQAVEEEKPRKTVVKVKDHLAKWLKSDKAGDEYRVISGGPGAGKSSLAKMFAVEQVRRSDNSWRILFVPLHRVNLKTSLADAIEEFLSPYPLVRHNPLAPGTNEPKLLLILDGLDEVTEQGKVGAAAARSLLQDVANRVAGSATAGSTLKVLVTGRPAAVDAAELTQARNPGVLLHLLSYKNDETEEDLRPEWWAKYAKWKKKSKQGLEKFIDKVPEDVTAQPLLLYLTAFAEDQGFQFDDDFNLNKLYGSLLEKIHERAWDKTPGHPTTARIEFDDFAEALEAVAVAAWHGSGRGITLTGVKQAHGSLPPALERMLESDQGLLRLMVAFYFQRSGFEGQEEAFEFTHKSFGEYLTARSIARRLGEIIEDLEADRKKPRRKYDIPEALADWARLCGPRKIDWDLLIFIRNEISTIEPAACRARQAELGGWISHVLENGMPMEQIDRLKTFGEQNRQSVNAETALLVMLDSCARVTGEPSPVEWPNHHSAANWLARILPNEEWFAFGYQNPAFAAPSSVVKASLPSWPLRGLDLHGADLIGANLRGAYLSRADVRGANLIGANLSGANLSGANLSGANLSGANLGSADLIGANLSDANLSDADLSDADLSGANLGGADLSGADLSEARNLENAVLTTHQRADLKKRGLL